MKGRYGIWCIGLLAWLIGFVAMAESQYDVLCRENGGMHADVTAWIEISGMEFCQPIMRCNDDDGFYADHDPSGVESPSGSLYTQATYNTADFSDPVTVIYGSSKLEGAPFRELQEAFSDRFEACREILVHSPEGTHRYEVFAAVPYSSVHILHYYDFESERRYGDFFDSIYSTRMLGMHLDEDRRPEYGEQVLILSTGIRGDSLQRYLVLAKRVDRAQAAVSNSGKIGE